MEHKFTNRLIAESSPYLLQHAHNPVDWHPWGKEALNMAHKENKPLLVSIGYSSCHWCHVMEHESFEDEAVATLMNQHFVCIKIDREEYPDIDQLYMNAVQLITGRGGWPLNCFALPDGRPFYGGTYFPKEAWTSLLEQVVDLFKHDRGQIIEHADQLEEGIRGSELVVKVDDSEQENYPKILEEMVRKWEDRMDHEHGGPDHAPKFPLPNNYDFLMRYAWQNENSSLSEHVGLTLDKMAGGGIYDQLGGGFSRYAVDDTWKVPHFEKMLYDNAQLVSLYSHAWKLYKKPLYEQVVAETLGFIGREMTSGEGLFYAALDADSEGVEGKYYVWKKEELIDILGKDAPLFFDYYRVDDDGYWEDGNYILMRTDQAQSVAEKFGLKEQELQHKISELKAKLLKVRTSRIRPGLDDKCLLSWNAMMIKAYTDAFLAFGNDIYLSAALKAADAIRKKYAREDGSLAHTYKEGKAKIQAYLDDYAFSISAYTALYEATFDKQWLEEADRLTAFVLAHFFDQESGMFHFTSREHDMIISRKTETYDNVIPSSNSVMAQNLYRLSRYFNRDDYRDISLQMLRNVSAKMAAYGSGFSNWALLMMNFTQKQYEVVITGPQALQMALEMQQNYTPHVLWAGGVAEKTAEDLPLLQSRYVKDKTLIYVCVDNTCQLPVEEISEAQERIALL